MAVEVTVSTTPNEHAMKYTLNRQAIESGYKTFKNGAEAEDCPVAKALFAIDGVEQVFLMADFVTVNKKADAKWPNMEKAVLEAIEASY
ncbi:MAG: NifU N-terminal domain-containing protein [Nitrospinae bacterium]|nr:NifU N-terminal domain-containing protein [Nitrospinota bacterium]